MQIDILNRYNCGVIFRHICDRNSIAITVAFAIAHGVNLRGADLRGAKLRGATWRGAGLQGADFRGADFRGADLQGADFQGSFCQGTDFRGADLQIADLRSADLRGALFQGADLQGTDFRVADLQGAFLQGAELQGSIWRGADLQGAFFGLDNTTPVIANIDREVYAAASRAGALNMTVWHSCETTHCRAGWVVKLAGCDGKALEDQVGTPIAAYLIYRKSGHPIDLNRFYDDDKNALDDMRERASATNEGIDQHE